MRPLCCGLIPHPYLLPLFPSLRAQFICLLLASFLRVSCRSYDTQTFFFLSHTCTFQLLDKPWSQVSSLLPPGSCLQFSSRIGFSNPTARRFFIECCLTVANSRSRAFRKPVYAQEKVPTNLYKYALGGARTHDTDLYQARGQPDTLPRRPTSTVP